MNNPTNVSIKWPIVWPYSREGGSNASLEIDSMSHNRSHQQYSAPIYRTTLYGD